MSKCKYSCRSIWRYHSMAYRLHGEGTPCIRISVQDGSKSSKIRSTGPYECDIALMQFTGLHMSNFICYLSIWILCWILSTVWGILIFTVFRWVRWWRQAPSNSPKWVRSFPLHLMMETDPVCETLCISNVPHSVDNYFYLHLILIFNNYVFFIYLQSTWLCSMRQKHVVVKETVKLIKPLILSRVKWP
jgi:hypothetical protein